MLANLYQSQVRLFQNLTVFGITLLLVGLLIWAALKIRSWYRGDADVAVSRDELLLQFRELHRQGGLNDDEYRSIKGRLVSQSVDAPAVGTETENQARKLGQEPCSDCSE